ncbi:MAG: hypothetical protein WBM31_26770, partial [Pseudolabrys sp.]
MSNGNTQLAIRSSVGDIFVMLLRAGINRRCAKSHLRKHTLVAGDFDMAERDEGLSRRKVLEC